MKLLTYRVNGEVSFGVVKDDGVVDAPHVLGGAAVSVRDLLEQRLLGTLADAVEDAAVTHALVDVDFLPPVPDPAKILCVGVNYADHREEAGELDIPSHPTIFSRFADSQVGHNQAVVRPTVSTALDYEGEVAIVIGRHIFGSTTDENALGSIAGLSCYNDLSVRDWQQHNTQWLPGKNFAGVGSFGPWLVTMDEFNDLTAVRLTTKVNGTTVQDSTLGNLIFDFAAIIRYISAFTPLTPGDVIVTGTPGGVGVVADPPRFLAPGDVTEIEVSGVGVLRNEIMDSAT